MNVCIETFGCRLNKAESLDMEAEFAKRGWLRVKSHADADMIIVRGCSVTSKAERETAALVAHIREKYPVKRIVVTGCVRERRNEHWIKDLPPYSLDVVPASTARAYLKVQDGCSGKCTFCTVPRFRGKSSSVPYGDVLARAKTFISKGYTEIVVTGCNLSLYASEGKRLPDLLAALADIAPDGARIRLGSLEPSDCASETLDAMASRPNICRFIHIPVQTGSEQILAAMCRPYTVKSVDELLHKANRLMPMAGIGCDMISGFPGETELHHEASIAFLKRNSFSNIHAFPYSMRPGTQAASMHGMVDRETRRRRAHELSEVVIEMRTAFAMKFKGREAEVVIENPEHASGWTGEYFRLRVEGRENSYKRREKVRVTVTEADGERLVGRAK